MVGDACDGNAPGARIAFAADDPTDVTFTASAEIFEEIFNGELEPTAAFMTGKLKIDGDMGTAMRLANVFS